MSRNVQSLERGLRVLEELVRHGPRGITEISHELDLDKTIVHRLLGTLQAMGYVQQDSNRKYMVGVRLRQIGAKALSDLDLRTAALPYMQHLVEFTKGVAHLAKMAEYRAIYIEKVQHPGLPVKATDVGGEAPGYCSAAGKVLWAHLSQLDLNSVMDKVEFRKHTENTITSPLELQSHLARVREQGYARDNEEHRLGLNGIGVPVFDYTGTVVASMCVAATASQMNELGIDEIVHQVLTAAQELSSELGYFNGNI